MARARWCVSSATPTGGGGSNRGAGRIAAAIIGGGWVKRRPWLLRGRDHGIRVVLLGQHQRHDTTQAPQSVTEARRLWITRYLNGRFVRVPVRVEVLVREDLGRGEPGQLRRICGERHAVAAGAAELSDAVAHWWVLDDDHRRRRREAVLWAFTGHAAAVFGDQLYDVLPQTRGGYGRVQDFGIRFGCERVVVHVEPHLEAGRLECNTARTVLVLELGLDRGRITIPIRNTDGQLRGVLRYQPKHTDRPKMLAIPGSRLGLIPNPAGEQSERILLVEGPRDMIAARWVRGGRRPRRPCLAGRVGAASDGTPGHDRHGL
jgi:hypothetical protein